ncbi:hypothetical protein PM082_011164 [Marasmius tenuissimus]|nr:hypothetical protein PM082_011164 [Marasmius tenuissimus]
MVWPPTIPKRWFGKATPGSASIKGVEMDSKIQKTSTLDNNSPQFFTASTSIVGLPQPVTHSRSKRGKTRCLQPTKLDLEEPSSRSSIWTRITEGVSRSTRPSTATTTTRANSEAIERRGKSSDELHGDLDYGSDEIDEVVVDRLWSQPISVQSSTYGDESSADSESTHKSIPGGREEPWMTSYNPLMVLRWRIWPSIRHFFFPRFSDPRVENEFQSEDWLQSKRPALVSSMFFIVNWILGVTLIQSPVVLGDEIYYYGLGPVLSIPLVLMCAYNWPRDHSMVYQCFLCVSAWSWSFYQVVFASLCGYGGGEIVFTCGTKDFLNTFYYTTALQTVALFGTNLKRLPALLGAIAFFVIASVLIIPSRDNWYRYIINFIVFEGFLLYVHYKREMNYRRVFDLRLELKYQFERTRKAQMNERKAADSKYRLTSYVFHEVRVPLNTALLAVQNMSASGTIAKSQELEFHALEGSLSMMSKVLNDVLDFNRMDSGKFESLARPYAFHQVMRSMFLPLQLATNARGLEFVTDLDVQIDEVARRAAYEFMGEKPEVIEKHLREQPSGEDHWGIVVGDETRLRQVVTNLASNACKFTPAGGRLTISTRLIYPDPHSSTSEPPVEGTSSPGFAPPELKAVDGLTLEDLSVENLERHSRHIDPPNFTDRIIVRIEITDTGSGIRPQDMAQSKLFSAFNQTEQGRRQGGKGTGLGLALVRLIVKLSGGRLGVRSKAGQGSTFWVELPLGVGAKAVLPPDEFPVPGNVSMNIPKDAAFTELYKVASRASRGGGSVLSTDSMVEVVDAAAKLRATQTSPLSLRSSSALHSLMDQGGSVELNLSKYDSHSHVPTRAIGDSSTGTDVPLTDLIVDASRQSEADSIPAHSILREPTPPPTSSHGDSTCLPAPTPPASPRLLTPATTTSETTSKRPRPNYVSLPSSSTAPPLDLPATPASTLVASPFRTPSVLFEALNVLVVDDDPMTRTLMKRLLERLGCNVTTAENGAIALKLLLSQDESTPGVETDDWDGVSERRNSDLLSRNKFACIFLDNQMPVMSGLKVVEELRKVRGRRDFVVGVTGNALITDQKEYLDAGADHVLTKPVLERSLKSMLHLADERRKQGSYH